MQGRIAQGLGVCGIGAQGDGDDGHIIETQGADQRRLGAGGDAVHVSIDLVIDLHQAALFIFAHVEAHRYQGGVVAGYTIGVIHPVQ